MELTHDFDRRIGSIACQAFDVTQDLEGSFKLVHSFQGLLDRPLIDAMVKGKYHRLLTTFNAELDDVKVIFDREKAAPTLGKNMPPTAGTKRFCRQLRNRITASMELFRVSKQAVFHTDEADLVYRKYQELIDLILAFEAGVYSAWAQDVGAKSDANLSRPLLLRDPATRHLSVNFDPQLVAVLREVKYLETASESGDIPDRAAAIYNQNESFYQLVGNLDIASTEYNRILDTLLPVETPLLADELASVNAVIQRATDELNWTSDCASEYCLQVKLIVEDLSNRLQKTKANVDNLRAALANWSKAPLIQRDQKSGLIVFDDVDKLLAPTMQVIRTDGERFQKLVEENRLLLKADEASTNWQTYTEYLDDFLLQGLFKILHVSVSYLLAHTDARAAVNPDGTPCSPAGRGQDGPGPTKHPV